MNSLYPKKNLFSLSNIKGRDLFYTFGARNAIHLFFREHRIKKILVPSYNCGQEIEPLVSLGIEIYAYKVLEDLSIDLQFFEKTLRKTNPDFVLVTHYFGFRNKSFNDLLVLCKRYKVKVLEDCAHCLPNELGSEGDVSVYSLRKFLPNSNLGALRINNRVFKINFRTFDLLFRNILCKKNEKFGPKIKHMKGYLFKASKKDVLLYKVADLQKISNIRKNNYQFLNELIGRKNRLFKEASTTPLAFPFIISERKNKIFMEKHLNPLPFWTKFHPAINWGDFPEAVYLKKNLKVLPINQNSIL